MVILTVVEGYKQGGGGSANFCVFKRTRIERQGAAEHFLGEGALLFRRQMVKRRREGLMFRASWAHDSRACRLGVLYVSCKALKYSPKVASSR